MTQITLADAAWDRVRIAITDAIIACEGEAIEYDDANIRRLATLLRKDRDAISRQLGKPTYHGRPSRLAQRALTAEEIA